MEPLHRLRTLRSPARFAVLLTLAACAESAPGPAQPTQAPPTVSETGGELTMSEPGAPAYGPACGGIAAFSCPGEGVCEDDPRDDCDPARGGADCGGVCRCESTALCPPGTSFDGSADVCACAAEVSRDDVCARVRCMAGTHCVSSGASARCVPSDR